MMDIELFKQKRLQLKKCVDDSDDEGIDVLLKELRGLWNSATPKEIEATRHSTLEEFSVLDQEVDKILSGPEFTHDCQKCIYIGKIKNNSEIYLCPKGMLGGSLIARMSSDGPDYESYPISIIHELESEWFREASQLAFKYILKDMEDSLWGTKEVSPQVNISSMREEFLSVAKKARIEAIGKIKMIEELQKEAALLIEVAEKAEDMALMNILDSV